MNLGITTDDYIFKPFYNNSFEIANNIVINYNNKLNNILNSYNILLKYFSIFIIKKKINIDIGFLILKYLVIKRYDLYHILYKKFLEFVYMYYT